MSTSRKAASVIQASIIAWALSSIPGATLLSAQSRPAGTVAYPLAAVRSPHANPPLVVEPYRYPEALRTASPSATCTAIDNCSFETGTFPNWVPGDLSAPFFSLQIGGPGISPGYGLFTSAPTDGSFAVLHGFDGGAPGTISVVQDVALPTDASSVSFDYRAGWDMLTYPGSTQARTFRVEIEPAGGGAPLSSQLVLSAAAGTRTLDTGDLSSSVPVSAYAGQTIRVVFRWWIPESSTGPGFFQLDNVGLTTSSPPSAVLYGCSRSGDLFTINLTSGAGTFVGALPSGATEIEYDPASGRAFLQAPDGTLMGQEFDITTAAGIGPPIPNGYSFTGLEYVGATLYGAAISSPCSGSTLRTLDPWSGTSVAIGATGVGPISGLAHHQATGTMYGITGCSSGNSALLTISLTTGVATVVGATGFEAGSLEFGPDGNLYGGGTGVSAGNLYRIDRTNGASVLVGPTGFATVTGLALKDLPAPPNCGSLAWAVKAPFNDPRTSGSGIEGGSASLIGGKIYVSHGYQAGGNVALLSAYDIATDTWSHGGPGLPDAGIGRAELAGGTTLGRHFAIGGRAALFDVEEYDPVAMTWVTRASLAVPRGGLGAASWAGKIYAIGGRSGQAFGEGAIYGTNEAYDPATNAWTTLAPMPTAVSDDYATVAHGGKVYVFGGTTGAAVTPVVQIYDVATDMWTVGTPMPTARGAAMAGVINGMIAVFGGFDGVSNLTATELYDPATDSWSAGPNMPAGLSEMAQGVTYDASGVYAIGSGMFGISGPTVLQLKCTGSTTSAPAAAWSHSFEIASGPNPSRDGVTISFSLPQPTPVACEIVDVSGRRIWKLDQRPMDAGVHSLRWNGKTRSGALAAGGVYLVRVVTRYGARTAKIVRMK